MMTKKTTLPLCFFVLMTLNFLSCKDEATNGEQPVVNVKEHQPFFKLSLAQWSLHRAFETNELDPLDFAERAKTLGFEGVEYVSGIYAKKIATMGMGAVLDTLKARSNKHEVENVLIMVDGEGDLAASVEQERNVAVDSHKKWVDAAQFLGCHSIRVNLFGSDNEKDWISNATLGLQSLAEYAKTKNINIIVENHGGFSSNAELLTKVMQTTDFDNIGTLPDFGNFCMKREGGGNWDGKCVEKYDNYKGVKEMMPFAKGVSAKSYEFDANGKETTLDYSRLLKIVKDAGYTDFVGVEFEGSNVSEVIGIALTRDLLLKTSKELE